MPLWLLDFKENAVRMIQYKGHTHEYKFFFNKIKNLGSQGSPVSQLTSFT